MVFLQGHLKAYSVTESTGTFFSFFTLSPGRHLITWHKSNSTSSMISLFQILQHPTSYLSSWIISPYHVGSATPFQVSLKSHPGSRHCHVTPVGPSSFSPHSPISVALFAKRSTGHLSNTPCYACAPPVPSPWTEIPVTWQLGSATPFKALPSPQPWSQTTGLGQSHLCSFSVPTLTTESKDHKQGLPCSPWHLAQCLSIRDQHNFGFFLLKVVWAHSRKLK